MMSSLSILVAYCYCMYNKINDLVNYKSFLCVALAILLFHLATNTISEYRDCQKGIDDVHSSETKYRLITGIVPCRHVLYIGGASFIIASILGIISLVYGTFLLVIPGLMGAGISLFYSEWPFGLKYKLLSEVCVFTAYAPLLFSACVISLIGSLSVKDVVFSVPFGLMTTAIVLINNIRDYKFDLAKSQTLATKFGLKVSYYLLFAILHLAFVFVFVLITCSVMPSFSFIVFAIYPIVFILHKKVNVVQPQVVVSGIFGKAASIVNILGGFHILFFMLVILSFLWSIKYR
ncbi:MAG: prenyltransferase [Holosporales bacterium]|nr:prenyltransferase [Holosporales bacterium]